jgi:hypothetical protein
MLSYVNNGHRANDLTTTIFCQRRLKRQESLRHQQIIYKSLYVQTAHKE